MKFLNFSNNILAEEIKAKNLTSDQVFLDYIESVAGKTKEAFPNVRALAWDTQFRKFQNSDFKISFRNKF